MSIKETKNMERLIYLGMFLFAGGMLLLGFIMAQSENYWIQQAAILPIIIGFPTVLKMLQLSFIGDGRKKKND